jgi:hypothetical protein
MYFSMIEDLPTDWSPRKMILYFVRQPTALEERLITIVIINVAFKKGDQRYEK